MLSPTLIVENANDGKEDGCQWAPVRLNSGKLNTKHKTKNEENKFRRMKQKKNEK